MSTAAASTDQTWKPEYSRWRHGGWYVHNCRYPSGAVGCVSNNYVDKKWRIVCGPHEITFSSRDDAAKAEYIAVKMLRHANANNNANANNYPLGWGSSEV